jgi:hypothetical protein
MQKQFLGKMRYKKECSITRFHVTYNIINSWLNFKLDVWETLEQADIESILNSAIWDHVPFISELYRDDETGT